MLKYLKILSKYNDVLGSGTPYSRQSNITQEAADGINDRSTLMGSINGSRLPWQFRLNAKFNKNFEIKWTKKKSSFVNAIYKYRIY